MKMQLKSSLIGMAIGLLVQGTAVLLINLSEGSAEAVKAGFVQLGVSAFVGFFAVNCLKWIATFQRKSVAYITASFGAAVVVAIVGGLAHSAMGTPDLVGTIAWNFSINFAVCPVAVACLRNTESLPQRLQRVVTGL